MLDLSIICGLQVIDLAKTIWANLDEDERGTAARCRERRAGLADDLKERPAAIAGSN